MNRCNCFFKSEKGCNGSCSDCEEALKHKKPTYCVLSVAVCTDSILLKSPTKKLFVFEI